MAERVSLLFFPYLYFIVQCRNIYATPMEKINNEHLRIATIEFEPWVKLVRNENGEIVDGKGLGFKILKTLIEPYSFTVTIETPGDNAYGGQHKDGSWTGMIAMILDNVSDVAVGTFVPTHPRSLVVDFTRPFYEESNAILTRAPSQENQLFTIAKPFQPRVWIILLATMILVSIFLWITSAIRESKIDGRRNKRFDHFFLSIYAVILTQSGQRFGNSSHVLAAFWCFSGLVFIHAYIGTLMSFLTVPILKPVLSSLKELPSSGLSAIVWRGTDLDHLFMEAEDDSHFQRIGDELRKNPDQFIDDPLKGPGLVLNGDYVSMNSKSYLEWMIEEDYKSSGGKCRLSLAKETFSKFGRSFALPKGSPLKPIFDRKIIQLLESGIVDYWASQYLITNGNCHRGMSKERPRHLTIENMKGAFIIWIMGVGLAAVAFIIEHLLILQRKYSKRNITNIAYQ